MASSNGVSLPPDENRGPEILAICGTLVALSVLIVGLRIWVRAGMIGQVGIDDWTIIAATTVIFVEMMIIIPQVHYGAGRHVQYIEPPSNVTKGLHLNFVTQPLCLIALCLTKVSVGFFLLRLTPSKRFRRFVIGMIIFTVLSATGNFLTVFFQCQPLAFTWGGVSEGKCMPPDNLKFAAFFNSSVAVLSDIIFALLPVPMLWKVQLNWRVKSAVAAILALGVFAAVAAIVKITFLGSYGKHGDFLWDSADLTIWYVPTPTWPYTQHILLLTTSCTSPGQQSRSAPPSSPPASHASSPSSRPCSTALQPASAATAPATRATSATPTTVQRVATETHSGQRAQSRSPQAATIPSSSYMVARSSPRMSRLAMLPARAWVLKQAFSRKPPKGTASPRQHRCVCLVSGTRRRADERGVPPG
uniref:Rhodopsin domain-containing protein n=1 Tax=Podospora anserina (strain S / ATCC MYA-4624 / DSM 980 / FGSC 10383) TaxID=515849 RepID=A0A090D5W7_PODAN|nr:Putative protein of unknown function [Podospora anserina S mat+]